MEAASINASTLLDLLRTNTATFMGLDYRLGNPLAKADEKRLQVSGLLTRRLARELTKEAVMYGKSVLCNVDGRLWFYGTRPGPHPPALGFIDPPGPMLGSGKPGPQTIPQMMQPRPNCAA